MLNHHALFVALLFPLAASAAAPGVVRGKPKLALVVVVDQLRRSDLERLGPQLTGGFRRLLDQGARIDGHYGQQNTYTAPGHALVLSGSYGYLNGIIQNKYFDRASGKSLGMLSDADAKYLAGETKPEDEVSPRNFNGSTVGDELRLSTGMAARAVAVAVKERGAILLGGRTGSAYFYSEATGEMTSTTYYMKALPEWATAFNAAKPADAYFAKSWDRLLPIGAYTLSGADDTPWEGDVLGLKRTFPHPLTGGDAKPGPKSYEALTMSPAGVELTFAFARAAFEGEKLGARGVTDLLAVSVSSTDLVGHTFGLYSQEYEDVVLATDRALGAFLTYLDGKLGKDGYVVALTADHGSAMPPEQAAKVGLGGVRVKKAAVKTAVQKALEARFGPGEWVVALEDPAIYLDWKLMADKKLDHAEVERVAGEGLLTVPGFVGYATRTALQNGWLPPTEAARAVARSFYPARSGDVIAIQAPYSYWGKYGEKDYGGSHGSFYRYDTDVPLVLAGPPFRPGYYGRREMVDLAATLAQVLAVNPPAACEGEPIQAALR